MAKFSELEVPCLWEIDINNTGLNRTFVWETPVDHTISRGLYANPVSPYDHYIPDRFGRNFGIGDIVLYARGWETGRKMKGLSKEGTVLELHQFIQKTQPEWHLPHPDRMFIALVDFEDGEIKYCPSPRLKALTNDHSGIEGVDKIPSLKDIEIGPSKHISPELKSIFDDPIARAIWIAYKRGHIVSSQGLQDLNISALQISQALRERPVDGRRIALWFLDRMRPRVDEKFALFMVPYLTGEEEATYKITPEKAVIY